MSETQDVDLYIIYCILSNREVIKYHKFISVVVIELSVRCRRQATKDGPLDLTHSCLMEFPVLIIWTNPF